MSTFLLEIGTEELPADFAQSALSQLEQLVSADLLVSRLSFGRVRCLGTPRRLVVLIDGLAERQEDLEEERKGPPEAQAFRDGAPTAAAIGFARRCGVAAEQLEVRDTPKGPFVFARILDPGRAASDLLTDLVPAWINGLQGRRFMRWGEGDDRFSRPIRWLVVLLGEKVLPVTLAGSDPQVTAGNRSRGHRLSGTDVTIASAESYEAALAASGVVVDRQLRADQIRRMIEASATASAAQADLPQELFEELTDLVEAPLLIEGAISDHSLDLPPEVLSTVMRAHQRYVPLYRLKAERDPLALEARSSLLPRFLCIGNGLPEAKDTVRRGNERVLKARLADAAFFLEADRAVASIDRRDQLHRVAFAKGLGSLRDRCERLEWCTDVLLEQLDLPTVTADHARRAAHLCKHDLVSQMVGEFPELQGVIGGKYLLAEGEPRPVALAVLEHYLPRGAGDALPGSDSGAIVALAERLELLLSIYAKGERPSGSSDPYALRRAGNGLLQILWERNWILDLHALLHRAAGHWAELLPHFAVDPQALAAELGDLLRQRLISLLEEEGIDADLVQAVAGDAMALERVLRDPADARRRAELLRSLRGCGTLSALQAVVTRAARLAAKGDLDPLVLNPAGVVEAQLFETSSEVAMLEVLQQLEPLAVASSLSGKQDGYQALADGLVGSAEVLAAFFDGDDSVLVMVDDPAVRRNRLNLLGVLRNQATVLADFSRISG